MIRKNITTLFILFLLTISACSQKNNDRLILGEANAKRELNIALSGTAFHNVISPDSMLIKDKETVINVVEPILFSIYKKENIIKQRPYETHLIGNYWVVSGTLPNDFLGGTFLIIIDATNSKIIRLTHGK